MYTEQPDGSTTAVARPRGLGAAPCCPAGARAPASGSRRRRIWELGSHAHCPVVGVCMPMPALRRLVGKVLDGTPQAADYELHCGVITECQSRSRIADALQRELDRRFMPALRQAAAAKTEAALAAWWAQQAAGKELPAALWATLTHARCTPLLEQQVLAHIHMLQHQVGMATRVELARFEALIDENAVLARELGRAQRRSAQQSAEKAEQHAVLQSQVVQLRGQKMAAESLLALQREDLNNLYLAVPDLASRSALGARCQQQAERIQVLQQTLRRAHDEVNRLQAFKRERAGAGVGAGAGAVLASVLPAAEGANLAAPTATATATATAAAPSELANRAVLCVGGRTASVPFYRSLVEGQGGRFLHHDGGDEQHIGQLESTLAAADLVICQTGCVSHNAYWRVKDHCKRTGKRCVFLESPSASGLLRALAELSPADPSSSSNNFQTQEPPMKKTARVLSSGLAPVKATAAKEQK